MITAILLFATVTLSWDWNTESYLGGYKVYAGTESGKPVASLDVGKVTTWNADNFLKSQSPGTKLFFVVTAYNTEDKEGKPTNEVSWLVPAAPSPTPTPTPGPSPTPTPVSVSWEVIDSKGSSGKLNLTYTPK